MTVLGCDISTTTIGISIISDNKLILIDYIKPEGENFIEKIESAKKQFLEKVTISIDKIITEKPNIQFKSGFSSAQILATILRFNGTVLYFLFQNFKIIPIEAMATTMRKRVIGIGRYPTGTDTKEEILKFVCNQEPQISNWPLVERGKNKGQLAKECYDMADSYICAKYGTLVNGNK